MSTKRARWLGIAWLLGLCLLTLGLGLGTASSLTYHEAFVALGGREILASGSWGYPTIGGRPWLEKPPLPFQAVAAVGWLAGGVSPLAARLPSALAATGLVLGVALLAAVVMERPSACWPARFRPRRSGASIEGGSPRPTSCSPA